MKFTVKNAFKKRQFQARLDKSYVFLERNTVYLFRITPITTLSIAPSTGYYEHQEIRENTHQNFGAVYQNLDASLNEHQLIF